MRVPRSLIGFWVGVLVFVALVVAWLAHLGPIPPELPPRQAGIAIPAPSPLLMARSSADPHWRIPHPSAYGVTPAHYYAARNTAPAGKPQVAIMIGGIGYAEQPSLDAVKTLPALVSLALTPYGDHDAMIAAAARAAGHETLMGIAMQVTGEPQTTPGDQALDPSLSHAERQHRLDWNLSRAAGYAGVTDAIGLNAPETYLDQPSAAAWLVSQLHKNGLFLILATKPGATMPAIAGQAADIVIDPNQGVAAEQAGLTRLAAIAKAKGHALGVLSQPTTPTIAALASWCATLASQGIVLVPVSALAMNHAPGAVATAHTAGTQ